VSASPRSAPGPDGRPRNPFEPFARAELEQSLAARFERQVERAPDRLAVRMGAESLTYARLDSAANRIAHLLLERLGPDDEPVALLLPQSVAQVTAVVGALKAGKIYVPLEPSQVPARLAEAIADAEPRLVLTDAAHRDLARQVASGPHVIEVEAAAVAPDRRPGLVVAPDSGAYIFYTSGSTGRPKGVLDSHRNVLHNVMRYTNTLHLCPEDRLTLLQGPAFSGAVSSLFGALLNGAASFPFDVTREGADRIAGWLAAEAITIYHSVPALFRLVAPHGASLPALRVIRLEGDRATMRDLELFRRHFPADCVLVNGLGATECGLVRQYFFTPTVRSRRRWCRSESRSRTWRSSCAARMAVRSRRARSERSPSAAGISRPATGGGPI
jgi:non-ribosomal peptide synthetase component F